MKQYYVIGWSTVLNQQIVKDGSYATREEAQLECDKKTFAADMLFGKNKSVVYYVEEES